MLCQRRLAAHRTTAAEAKVSDDQVLRQPLAGRGDKLCFLLMKGPPGSGKSTLARALSWRLGWPLIDKDDIQDLLDDSNPGLAYEIMFSLGRRQLLQGLSVICDSPLGYRRGYERAVQIAQETGAHLAIIECICADEDVWRQRIEARQELSLPTHHTTDWAGVQAYQQRIAEDEGYSIAHPHLVLDTSRPIGELCDHVLRWLEQPGGVREGGPMSDEQQGTDWRYDRVGSAEWGENPMVLARMHSGYAVMGDTQFLPGYCLLLASPWADKLTDLPLDRRSEFLLDMSVLGEAVESACRPHGLRRVNYEISGNREPFLHAHVWPRYEWEPEEYVSGPVGRYPLERRTHEGDRYGEAAHGELGARITIELLALMDRTGRGTS